MKINGLGLGNEGLFAGRQTIEENSAAGFKQHLDAAVAKQEKRTDPQQDPRLKEACQEMEAVFLNMMMKSMRATVQKSSLLGDTSQEEIFRSMLDAEMTKNMAHAGGTGFGDMLYRQLSLNGVTVSNKGQAQR
ncbi:rod-binding protein [Acetonema longum]|uniref:Peptidase M23 n=1 Tax=Acetonema longum DSM 6540 TaxID=1009370 RepID=F7NIV4_9FIRM|nr:rod-binding protein [Acetonema longum]EGO64077.1 Peptidase M23 [Acetonema longum DSM 6540]